MGNNVSANTLFHFTDSIDNILNILENNFWPHYSLENLGAESDGKHGNWYIPMVCFCDIPLSQISNHKNTYGHYAIGLEKDWGIENGVTPVLYCHGKSMLYSSIDEIMTLLLDGYSDEEIIEDKRIREIGLNSLYQLLYMKKYEGYKKESSEKIRFYDEREWRFIPPADKVLDGSFLLLNESVSEDKGQLNKCMEILKSEHLLKFTPKSINYIIVDKENEIIDMYNKILKVRRFPEDELKLLTTKIISMDRIVQDF